MEANIRILEPSGILDGTQAEAFRKEVDAALDEGVETLLIDLKKHYLCRQLWFRNLGCGSQESQSLQ